MQEVGGVEPLPIKARHLGRNLYLAIAFKPYVLTIPASATSILDHLARERFCSFNGEE